MNERKFLWRPDPAKEKDFDAGTLLKAAPLALPQDVALRRLIISVLNQGELGSCVLNAVFQAVRGALVRMGIESPELGSRLFGYYFARAISGNTQRDEGTWIRCAFDVIRKLGYPPESTWSYDDGPDKFKRMPSADAVRAAYDQRTSIGYYRIKSTGDQRIEDIKKALASDHLVVFGTLVSDVFGAYAPGHKPLGIPKNSERILGGHALTVTGYWTLPDGTVLFDILNSWSSLYGDRGYCTFTAPYLAWKESQDFWIVETMPNFSE